MDEIWAIAQLQALLGLVWPAASNLIAVLLLLFGGGPWVPADIAGSSQPWLTTRTMGRKGGGSVGERDAYCDDGAQVRYNV